MENELHWCVNIGLILDFCSLPHKTVCLQAVIKTIDLNLDVIETHFTWIYVLEVIVLLVTIVDLHKVFKHTTNSALDNAVL